MTKNQRIAILRFSQWMKDWDSYDFNPDALRRRPDPYIYVFTMSATRLRGLSDVYRRERSVEAAEGIQRAIEESRTATIKRYVKFGYPFGTLKVSQQSQNEHLRKPGWLPTAIVINILTQNDERRGLTIASEHMATVCEEDGHFSLQLPTSENFEGDDLRPFEVIDGQHRLWAFDEEEESLTQFEVPVVAFRGLDVAWQAYLFWSINISPKRINPSHAFDLYPLLRTQDWLHKTGELRVYREARAQELTEWLYVLPSSPWFDRISMLQRKGEANVSQAAWVRSLLGSFFGTGRGKARYGLFQAQLYGERSTLGWVRVQQIAFLVQFWNDLRESINNGRYKWVQLYEEVDKDAFEDKSSMLNQDMGIRAVNAVANDIFFFQARAWGLVDWYSEIADQTLTTREIIDQTIHTLNSQSFRQYISLVADAMASFDWRSLTGPGDKSSTQELEKRAYRGTGGYTLLSSNLLKHMSHHCDSAIVEIVSQINFE